MLEISWQFESKRNMKWRDNSQNRDLNSLMLGDAWKCIDDVTRLNKYLKQALEQATTLADWWYQSLGRRPIVYHKLYENLKFFMYKSLLD